MWKEVALFMFDAEKIAICETYGHDCEACTLSAPFVYCCRLECGEHDYCRDCAWRKGEKDAES